MAALLLLWLPVKSAAGTCSTGESSMLQMGRQIWGRRRAVTTEPPDPETPDNMPEYTVRISGKGGNLGFLAARRSLQPSFPFAATQDQGLGFRGFRGFSQKAKPAKTPKRALVEQGLPPP